MEPTAAGGLWRGAGCFQNSWVPYYGFSSGIVLFIFREPTFRVDLLLGGCKEVACDNTLNLKHVFEALELRR